MEYEIIYSSRRTLGVCVKDGRVIVRSPYGVPREHIEKELYSHKEWIEKHVSKQEKKKEITESLNEKQISLLRKNAREILTEKTKKYAEIMGLKFGRITITGAKTRFGSCNSKGNIAYSWRLLLYPEAAQDYVVVHELSHLVEMNHSQKFYRIVEKYLPDYKERRKLLK